MTASRSVLCAIALAGVVWLGGCADDEVAAPSPTVTANTTEDPASATATPAEPPTEVPPTEVPVEPTAAPTFVLVIPTPTPGATDAPADEVTANPTAEPTDGPTEEPTVEVTPPPTDPPLPADEDEQEGTGEPVFEFDEAAALVCANAEYALDAADAGDDATYSSVAADMATWSAETTATNLASLADDVIDAPSAADGRDAVITLLEACADAGYQL